MTQRRRIFTTTLLGLAIATVAAPTAFAHPFVDRAASTTPPQIRALELRSEGLNTLYGTTQAIRALQLRSEALNRQYAASGSVTSSGDSVNWSEGAAGAAGVFATVLVLAGAIAVTRRRGTTPLGA